MRYFSNEIVFRGHPDKCCDQIGAAILAECVKQDKNTRAGIEVTGGKGKIFVTGEVTTKAKFNVKKIVKRVLSDVGYKTNYKIIDNLGKQSPDIAQGVNVGGAGGFSGLYAVNTEQPKIRWRIRKLIEKECWRLMNFTDEDHDRAAKYTSASARYKQAGNSIVVACLIAIFSSLFIEDGYKSDIWTKYSLNYWD